jgi:hypothetical protein
MQQPTITHRPGNRRRARIRHLAAILAACGILATTASAQQSILDRIRNAAKQARRTSPSTQQPRGRQPQPFGTKTSTPSLPASSAKVEAQTLVPGIASANSGMSPGVTVSPRGVHVALAIQRGSRSVVNYDGVDGPKFDEILTHPFLVWSPDVPGGAIGTGTEAVAFSPDGKRYLYIAREAQDFVVMVDGKEMFRTPASAAIVPIASVRNGFWGEGKGPTGAFTPDSKHVFFVLRLHLPGGGVADQLVWDGKKGPPTQQGIQLAMSADGEHYAYVARNPRDAKQWALIVDGKPAPYHGLNPLFTADGSHLYTTVDEPTAQLTLLDGKPWLRSNGATLFMAPVGDRVVAAVHAPGQSQFLYADGKRIPGDCFVIAKVRFSPDGKRWAADCEMPTRRHAVYVDGKRGQEYTLIRYLGFTPDSSESLYAAAVTTATGERDFMVVDNQESDGYAGFGAVRQADEAPAVFARGGHVAFTTKPERDNTCAVVVDGKAMRRSDGNCANLALSPDGSRFAYLAGAKLVVDGVEDAARTVKPFAPLEPGPAGGAMSALPFLFSPDSKHLASYGYLPSRGTWAMFMDGRYLALPSVVGNYPPNFPMFTPDSRHFIFAARAGEGFPQAQNLVVYVDGRPSVYLDGGAMGPLSNPNDWEMGADGTLTLVAVDHGDLKRIRITPAADTSVDTMLSDAQPIAGGR